MMIFIIRKKLHVIHSFCSLQINAYMLCGKLKSAYLIAVRRNNEEDIQRIAGAAQRAGQSAMFDICQKWLRQKQGKK
jgi:zinc finger FYVE domain-containing protein 26